MNSEMGVDRVHQRIHFVSCGESVGVLSSQSQGESGRVVEW